LNVRDFKGMDHQPLAASQRFRTIKICPKDIALVWQHSRPVNGMTLKAEERQGIGHRMGDGLFNRDYPARASVGKLSGVSQRPYRTVQRARATRDGVHAGHRSD